MTSPYHCGWAYYPYRPDFARGWNVKGLLKMALAPPSVVCHPDVVIRHWERRSRPASASRIHLRTFCCLVEVELCQHQPQKVQVRWHCGLLAVETRCGITMHWVFVVVVVVLLRQHRENQPVRVRGIRRPVMISAVC